MKNENKWDFILHRQDHLPPHAIIIDGEDIELLELIEIDGKDNLLETTI